jgi:CubicO group peptidase (beta-lactamase class C family)
VRDGGARPPVDLEAVQARALGAWLEDDAGIELDDDARLPGGVEAGFAERVMAAESAVVAVPALVAIDVDPTPDAAIVTRPASRRWGLGLAAALVAGLSSVWAVSQPNPTSSTQDAATPRAAAAERDSIARPAGLPIPTDLDARIGDYIADYGRHFGPTFEFHGAILVARDGKIHYQHGFGIADPRGGVANKPTTRMRIGMLTEQFTAAAILQLRDAGMLELSDPIAEHLPGFPNGRRITIENLLDHTSGIPNYTDLPTFHRWKALPHRTEEMVGRFSELPLEFEPGSDFNPTNSGYYLLGAIIERCSGMSYGEYMQRYVFEPAGMTRTGFGEDPLDVARGNVWNEEEQLDPPDPIDMSVFGAAGGLVSTVEDFALWDQALYGGNVLPVSSIEQMFDANRFGYGFGWLVGEAYDQPVVSFPGAIDGFNAAVMRFLEDRTLVVVLANTEVVPAGRIAQDIAMMIYGEQPAPRIEFPEVEVAPGTFTRYVGTYGITDETIRVLGDPAAEAAFEPLQNVSVKRIGDRLYFDVPGHGSTWMHPMGRHRFFFKDNSGNYLTFATGEDGVATGLMVQVGDAELELARKGD